MIALTQVVSFGPTIGGALTIDKDQVGGLMTGGIGFVLLGDKCSWHKGKSDSLTATVEAEGGYQFGQDYAIARAHFGVGWHSIALGLSLMGGFTKENAFLQPKIPLCLNESGTSQRLKITPSPTG